MKQATCPHCGRTLEDAIEIVEGHCASDDCPRRDIIETFVVNLRYALRNHEVVTIGGGEFTPAELAVLIKVLEAQT